MFITATAPNPLVVKLIADATGAQIQLSWGTWALAMRLPGLVAIALMPWIIYLLYPPEIKRTPNAAAFAREKLDALGAVQPGEWVMLGTFALLLVLWAGVPAMLFGPAWSVDPTTTAFIGLAVLLFSGVLDWEDVLKEKSAWDTVVWSHITAMFAAFYTAGLALGAPPMPFALIMAAASSIMMTLTHYATGTSPVIFGSGYTTLGEWWKVGFVMSVLLLVWVVVGGAWWRLLGHW